MLPIVSAVLAAVAPTIASRVVERVLPRSQDVQRAAGAEPLPIVFDVPEIAHQIANDPEVRRAAEEAAKSVAKPWWQSKGVLGGAGVVLMSVGSIVGLAITAEDAGAITDNLDKIATGLCGLYAIYGRIVARSPLK